ncbi:hypothetical protein Vi05172_g13404 [Venturia inaequalis]|nr:hypothetical protein Vi05172_g13404 [Venturia inaequalis]
MASNTATSPTEPTKVASNERDLRMSENCEIIWGTQFQFDFGLEKTDNGKHVIYIRRIHVNGGELLLLSGVHEDNESAWDEVDMKLIKMTEFVREKKEDEQKLAKGVAEKKAAEDRERVRQVAEKKENKRQVEEWPELGSGMVSTRNSRKQATIVDNSFGLGDTAPQTNSRNGFGVRYPAPETRPRIDSSSKDDGLKGYESRNYDRSDYGYSRNYGRRDYQSSSYGRNEDRSRNVSGSSYGSRVSASSVTDGTEDGKKPEMSQDERLALWGRIGERRRLD